MRRVRKTLFLAALVLATVTVPALEDRSLSATYAANTESWPDADPADVESIDTIIAALYDVISGPAGEERDWDRFHSLFIPQARLIPTGRSPSGEHSHNVMSPDEYVASSGPILEERGFFEIEVARATERFGDIAHAFSTYESRSNLDDREPFARGINSIQLMHDGQRWWIVNVFWASERDDLPIPTRYLPGGP